ncbi:uncharacterized protein N7446_007767, partial [Penicillium canescens]|uniref:uncharacterized protein n=1 Tax=Penicillium canescens TaxID=5083 RepID=UPI0026DF8329
MSEAAVAVTATATTLPTASTNTITTLAMTTVFTPPASCSSSWTFEPSGANNIASGLLLQNAAASDNADPNCFPSGYTHFGRQMASIAYSPGVCPVGYTTANLVIHNPVTTAQCCLSNFEYLTVSMGEDSTYAGCTSMLPSDSSTIVTVRQVSGESTQVSGPITMWAQPIQIQLQATDASLFTTATSTSASASNSATATATSTSTSTSTSASGAPSSSSGSGLSQGASIGIGVGVGVGGALIIAVLAFWFFRRRQTKRTWTRHTSARGIRRQVSSAEARSRRRLRVLVHTRARLIRLSWLRIKGRSLCMNFTVDFCLSNLVYTPLSPSYFLGVDM